MLPWHLTRRELRLIFLEITFEITSITLEQIIEKSHRIASSRSNFQIPIGMFIEIAIKTLKEMYIARNNWIQIDVDGRTLRTQDIESYFKWESRSHLQIRITLRGVEMLEGQDDNDNGRTTSTPEDAYREEVDCFSYHDIEKLIWITRNPPRANDIESERMVIARQIKNRRGQSQFRSDLIEAYGQCLITGCRYEPILEAAHITPYCLGGGFQIENGLLLRADIHTLFDLGLITICTEQDSMIIKMDKLLYRTEYAEYANKSLLIPEEVSCHPDRDALNKHRSRFGLENLCP